MQAMLKRVLPIAIFVSASAAAPALAQIDRFAAEVVGSVPPAAAVVADRTVPQLHVRWIAGTSPGGNAVRASELTPVNRFEVVGTSNLQGPLQRERDPQLAEHELVIVSSDASGRETSWQKLRDPRVLRAETPGPTGELSGEVLYRPEVELTVIIPDASTTSLRVYETYWSGEQFLLRPLGLIEVTAR
jgi:hypothetical protein